MSVLRELYVICGNNVTVRVIRGGFYFIVLVVWYVKFKFVFVIEGKSVVVRIRF